MTITPDSERAFPSTHYAWRKVKISQPPAGQKTARRSRSGFLRLHPWPRTRPVRLTVTYRGGAEGWWLVEARGTHQAFPGHLCFEEVLSRVFSER